MNMHRPPGDHTTAAKSQLKWKLPALILISLVVAIGYWQLRDVLTFEYLAARESALRQFQDDRPLRVFMIALAIYTVVAGLSLPVAMGMTIACGWYFGFWQGLAVASFGSTAGATLAFLISRYLFRDWAQQKMSDRLGPINDAFEREGVYYLLTLRLLPFVAPYFIVNAVMGLTRISAFTFWWVSQLGMLPGTAIHVYAGSTVPTIGELSERGVVTLMNWQLLLALTLLAIFPLLIKKLLSSGSREQAKP